MFKNIVTCLSFIFITSLSIAQTVPAARITDWSKAGMQDSIPIYSNVADVMNFGGVKDSTAPNDAAFTFALNSLGTGPGTIYFPAGKYIFTQPITLRDSVVIKGAGKTSRLYFDLGHATQDMIKMLGSAGGTSWDVVQPAAKNSNQLVLNNSTGLAIGDWVVLYGDDSDLVTSPWAYGTVGQIFRITNIVNTTITANQALRMEYPLSYAAKVKRFQPIKGAGVECIYIERLDSTINQTVNINMTYAVNCWVTGIESNRTNFAHVGLTDASHILIRGNYFHHSHNYGGSGQGYGVMAQYTTGDCLIENNTFKRLRHSMLVHLGANGNVFGYNYSTDPFWTEPSLPANSAGDAVCHGNYPYLNLFEGNILQQIVIDDSHGENGPYNTFFRNRAELFGIFQNTTFPTDSTNYAGNEITNTVFPMGLYSLAGLGNYQFGNNVKGTMTPNGTNALLDNSLYLTKAPGFWKQTLSWPNIGTPKPYNQGDIPAKQKFVDSSFIDCTRNPNYVDTTNRVGSNQLAGNVLRVYPNPANDRVVFDLQLQNASAKGTIVITDITGKIVRNIAVDAGTKSTAELNTHDLAPGIYLYKLMDATSVIQTGRIAIVR